MRILPSPTLDRLAPIVAELPEPFTIKDIVAASGMVKNVAHSSLMTMKKRGWVENTGKRVGGFNGPALWIRTRWFGTDRNRTSEEEQRTGLERLFRAMTAWTPVTHDKGVN